MTDIPKYLVIARALADDIETGVYKPGDQIPGERTLMGQWGVARNTTRQAIQLLASEGLVHRSGAKGVAATVAHPSDYGRCGGCAGLGSHRRHCPHSPTYNRWLELADRAEDLGDQIGSNDTQAANHAYAIAGHLRRKAKGEEA